MAPPIISKLARSPRLAVAMALPLLFVAITLVGGGRVRTALAVTAGPTIQVSGPSVVDANAPIDISFTTTGTTANAYAGYQVSFQYDTTKVRLSDNGPADDSRASLWPSRSCTSSWDGPADPSQTTKTVTLSCRTTSALATFSAGAIAHAHFTAVGTGLATFHVLTSGTSTLDANGTAQTNTITPTDIVVDIAPTDLAMSVSPAWSVASTGDTRYFYLTVTNLSTTRSGTGVVVTDTFPAALPLAQYPLFLAGASACTAQGQTVQCNVGTIAPSGTWSVGVITGTQWGGVPSNQDCATVTLNEHDLHLENNTSCTTSINSDGPAVNVTPSRLSLGNYRLTFATTGSTPNPYNNYMVTVVYDSSRVSITNINALPSAQALWGTASCNPSELASDIGGTLANTTMRAFTFNCNSYTAPGTTHMGTIGTVDVQMLQGSDWRPAAFHMLSLHAPDNGYFHASPNSIPYGSYTMMPAGAPGSTYFQSNALTCSGVCGAVQGLSTQPWDALMNYPSPDLSFSVSGTHSPIVAEAVENFTVTVRNPSTTTDATGASVTTTLSSSYDGSRSRVTGTNGGVCTITAQVVSCPIGTLAPGASFSFVIQALATQLTSTADINASLTWNYYQPPSMTKTLTRLGRVSVEVDTDGDGYADSEEIALGQNPNLFCLTMRADLNYDGVVNSVDQDLMSSYLGTVPPSPGRYDLSQPLDHVIDSKDSTRLAAVVGHSISECSLVASPDVTLNVSPNHSPIVPEAVESFAVTVTNPATDADASGVALQATLSPAFDGSRSRIGGTNASQCTLTGQVITCPDLTILRGSTFSIVVQALATQLTSSATLDTSLSWSYNQPPNTTKTVTAAGSVSVGVDSDGDGYADSEEIALGKDPNTYCAIMRADVNYDGTVNTLDTSTVSAFYLQLAPPAPARYDQNGDGAINILDISRMVSSPIYFHSVTECP